MRKQEIILFLSARQTVPQKLRKLTSQNELIIDFRGKKTKPSTTEFHSCTTTANIGENNEK